MLYHLLYLVPKNWLSRCIGHVVGRRWPFGLHRRLRDALIRAFRPDVEEAALPLDAYETWQAFFTRRLRPGARPSGTSPLVCPVDGTLTQRGHLEPPRLSMTQIKGIDYTLEGLLGGWETAPYVGGSFLTVYLAPWNYHRIHAPARGRVTRARHVAGALWPVNAWSVRNIRELFVRNDRVLVEMECPEGRLAIAMVGATNVGRTTLAFSDLRGNAPPGPDGIRDFAPKGDLRLSKGDDLACFEMGSTIVLVLDAAWTARLQPGLLEGAAPIPVRLGLDLAIPSVP